VSGYREFRPPAGLVDTVACLWLNAALVTMQQRVIPDGCVDLVWLGDRPVVVGADTGPVVWEPLGMPTSGIRLRPGSAGAVLGLPASEVRDQVVDLADVWPDEPVVEPVTAPERLRMLTETVLRRHAAPDPLVVAATGLLGRPGTRVATVASDLGVSERHLNRRLTAAIGYGPKTFARVARLRRLIALRDGPLADRAYVAGYAGQAHMTDEVRRLTGLTPARFLEDAALTAA
jgi:AraC-like DNA-binding protein